MKKHTLAAVLITLVLVLVGPSLVHADEAEQRVFEMVNAERARHGLPALVISQELTNSARAYAGAMASGGFFGHEGPDGSTLVTRNEGAGYRDWTYLAENLAAGQTSPDQAMDGWLGSEGHRANILSPHVREIGIGHVVRPGSKYGQYWVQEYGNRPGIGTVVLRASASQEASFSAPSESWLAPTGHVVSGNWLTFLRSHGNIDTFGLPRTEVIDDPAAGNREVQFFQRVILEWHSENPPGQQIQRRLLGDMLYPGAEPPVSSNDRPPGASHYFPFSPDKPTGLGHFVADYTRSGQPIYFRDHFDRYGGAAIFGYPKEEPTLRNGRWTQRFQAAVFEYHPEFDRDGVVPGTNIPLRNYRVQLELLGDKYIEAHGVPQP